MTATRRQFLQTSLGAGALAGLSGCTSLGRARRQHILILGGTGFLGPALIDATLARGHKLTLFNSGSSEQRREEAGIEKVVPPSVEVLLGNRDPELTADDRRLARDPDIESKRDPNSPKGLSSLEGRSFDAVIDTSGYFPRMVRASAELLAPNVDQYVFISSISVYTKNDTPWMDEDAELLTLDDPTVEEFGANFENYGGGKALCEQAAETALPGRTTNVRPGYIVGRRDTSRRFLYWPWRTSLGGEMIVPGTPEDPIQIIDVRDLAEWIVTCVENRTVGEFNATGPAEELSMRRMVEGCRAASGADTSFTWVDGDFTAEQGLRFPIWLAPKGDYEGFHRVSIERALRAGLRFRSIEDTAASCMAWYDALPKETQERVLPAWDMDKEAEVLRLWRERG